MLLFGKGTALACTNKIFPPLPFGNLSGSTCFLAPKLLLVNRLPPHHLQDTNKLKIQSSVSYYVYLPLTEFIIEALGLYLK